MDYQRKITGVHELKDLAQEILGKFPDDRIFVLDAPMGRGKTTFVKTICEQIFETEEVVSSPTFAILNVYTYQQEDVFHFDFYRLENKEEALDIGFDDYLYSGSYCFIEWPDLIMDYIPERYIRIQIEDTDVENERIFKAEQIQN
jgi:tRNA threonylcarbamoyladenosine biosynthesis protein TsaE